MSQGEGHRGYPSEPTVFKDASGKSWIFDPQLYDTIERYWDRAENRMQWLFRQKANPGIWFVLDNVPMPNVMEQITGAPQIPNGTFMDDDGAVTWMLDRTIAIPPDVDFEDRYEPPGAFKRDDANAERDKPSQAIRSADPTRPKLIRNLTWYTWYHDESANTHRSHAKIRDRWNAENPRHRIDMDKSDSGRGVVKQGIAAATRYLAENAIDAETALKRLGGEK